MSGVTALGAVLVGGLVGLSGIGGVFLVPLLLATEGLRVHQTIGTVLVCFAISQVVGVALYARRGAIDWRTTLWLVAGTLPFGPLGARLSVGLPGPLVKALFVGFLLFMGVRLFQDTLWPPAARKGDREGPLPAALLLGCGAFAGLVAGVMGVGGPILVVPVLLLLGMPVTTTVGVSQALGLAGALTGAVGHALFGEIHWPLALALTACTTVGIVVGARLNRHARPRPLRLLVGTLCLAVAPLTLLTPGE